MNITRISEFQSKQEVMEDLREFLISIMPIINSSEGCEAVQLYQSQDDPTKFMMIETWDSIESHQASVRNIPPEKLGTIRPMLATASRGTYYDLLHHKK